MLRFSGEIEEGVLLSRCFLEASPRLSSFHDMMSKESQNF